jgi:hypothetical protein
MMSAAGNSVIQYFQFDENDRLTDYIWSIRYMKVMSDKSEYT